MNENTKKDLKISLLIGSVAGVLILPILVNINFPLTLLKSLTVIIGLAIFTAVGYLVGNFISRYIPVIFQFVKFGIVGGLNAMIDLGVLNFLIYLTGIATGIWYSGFKSFSFIIAVVNSYYWNKHWTFNSENKHSTFEFVEFFLVSLVGFSINVGVASLVVNFVGAPVGVSAGIWANVGAVAAALSALMWNFIGMKFFVFKK